MAFFAVTTEHGPAWDGTRPIQQQRAWDEHDAFMDGLVAGVLTAGPAQLRNRPARREKAIRNTG